MEKEAQGKGSKETDGKLPDSSRIKMNKANSTEKLSNAQTDQPKGKSTSKLPRIIRMPSRFYKPIDNFSKTNVNSGDIFPGPSKFLIQGGSVKKEDIIPEKLAISHIPRLKAQREGCKENSVSVKRSRVNTHNQFIPECRNIQRVNILINPEFCPEDRTPPASVQSTRPIPSLGQIYGRINMIDSGRLNDWFLEMTTPLNSTISSTARTTETSSIPNDFNNSLSSVVAAAAHCHQDDLQKTSTVIMEGKTNVKSGFKNVNDNVSVWISTDDSDFPAKDNESGYQTMSPKNMQNSKTSVILHNAHAQAEESMKLNVTYCVGLSNDNCKMSNTPTVDMERSTDTKSLLKEQPTVVIVKQKIEEGTSTSKTYVPHKNSRITKTDASTNKGTSNGNQTVVTPTSRAPVPSYTDCLSEVLQKTTNFEIIEAIDSTKSPSSSADADTEIRDSSSNGDVTNASCDKQESTTVDSSFKQQSKSSSEITFLKSDTTVAHKWSVKSHSENSSASQHKTNKRYYDESRHNEMKERCKKCQRFKRFPSSRYKLPRNFGSWRSRISIRRLCCRRWNHVWKKTTERWAIWSTRSPKSRRLRALHLTRSILWEDVDIQTNTLAYTETGTNSMMKEQKSAAITTLFNMGTMPTMSKLTETDNNTLKTSEKNLSGSQFPQYQQNESTSFNDNLTCTTYTDAAMSSCNSVKSCQHEETEDLQNLKADKVTDPISRHNLRKHASNMTIITQKLIMCNNAETGMRFPCFGSTSKSNVGSGSDITYYRPMASSDITHLVSETKTSQALYPILRKRYSTVDSPVPREEGKRCASTSIVNIVARDDFGVQIEEKQLKRTEDIATEMLPLICVVSTGITPSYREIGEKEELFVSECLLMNNEAETENLGVQTRSAAPELAFGATKLLSISSKQLNKFISKTAKQTQTDKKFLGLMNKGLRGAVGVDSKLLGSHLAVVSKPTTESIVCKPDEGTTVNPSKAVSCGTDAKALFYFTKSTSARGLESYYETEILLNNLIKKALISNCGSPPHAHNASPFSDKSETSIKSKNAQMNTSTSYTQIILDSKSAGPTVSDVCKLVGIHKTDAEIQYAEHQEKPAPKCAAIMTSYCGLPESIQVPTASASATTIDKEMISHKFDTSQFTCNLVGFDIETNTNYKAGPLMENLAQTSTVQTKQETVAVNICRNCLNKPKSKLEVLNNVTNPLLSLSRLIGKKRTESAINSASVNKWLSEYSSMETALKSLMPDGQNQIRKPCFSLKSNIDDSAVVMQCNDDLPTLNLSRDSLADVLPVNKLKDVHTRKSDTELSLHRVMIDRFTSDDYVTKDVKESMLQACPEIRDTGTESVQTHAKKSAAVLTTQCVLPTAPSCSINLTTQKRSPDCVFVYGEPRCVVHKDWADAAVQPDLQANMEVNLRKEYLTHSVGQLTSRCALRDHDQINPSVLIREVLSPKVYKALYETTKLVVNKDAKHMTAKNTTVLPTRIDAGVEAAMVDMPTLKSASILTSDAVLLLQSRCHCSHNLNKEENNCQCDIKQLKKNVECLTVSEDSHKESNEECCEDCMKRHLVTSCRYYSNLLTKQLGRVKHNLTKHLAPIESDHHCAPLTTEVCTMKPSGRNASASQTLRHHSPYFHPAEHLSCCTLSPATSLTNICKYDKAHLKSVYYMLSAIEGRLRRLKLNAPSTYCQ